MTKSSAAQLTQLAVLATGVLGFVCLTPWQTLSASGAPSGEQTFKSNCASCHAGGGNIVDPKKPLKGSGKLASTDAFKAYLLKGAGAMQAFPKIANDAPTLAALYSYCKTLK